MDHTIQERVMVGANIRSHRASSDMVLHGAALRTA